jgi:serine/threonine protein phosphatase PrpC
MSQHLHAPLFFDDHSPIQNELPFHVGQVLDEPAKLKLTRFIYDAGHYQVFIAEPIGSLDINVSAYEVWVGTKEALSYLSLQIEAIALVWQDQKPVIRSHIADQYAIVIREIEPHFSLAKILEEKSQDQAFLDILNLGLLLAKKLAILHQKGYALGGFHPKNLGLNDKNEWLYLSLCLYPSQINQSNQLASQYSQIPIQYAGYSPPEAYGHFQSQVNAKSDVFSLGLMLFYALTKIKPFQEAKRPFHRLPSPLIYQPLLPPELVAVIRRAISPFPYRRFANGMEIFQALFNAKDSIHKREKTEALLRLEVGHDIHVGLIKGQYNPINQDDLFLGYQPDHHKGLFVITDGVSISEHGTGDIASGYVKQESFEVWKEFVQMPIDSEDETMAEFDSTITNINGPEVISKILNRANQKIADHVNIMHPVFHGPPEGIMAATAVIAVMEKQFVTFGSVGDSRIYLIRNGQIISLMNDDDLATHLMQMGQSPTQAYQSSSAAALINCVGEFKKNQQDQLVPALIKPQILQMKLLPNDQIVLCSDGIPDYAGYDEEEAEMRILDIVQNSITANRAAFELISIANRGGGGDNISCIVLRCHQAY